MTKDAGNSALVDNPNLLAEEYRVLVKPGRSRGDQNMGWKECTPDFCCERRDDCVRTRRVGTIDLQNDGRADARLLSPNYGIEIAQDNVAPVDCHHWISPAARRSS